MDFRGKDGTRTAQLARKDTGTTLVKPGHPQTSVMKRPSSPWVPGFHLCSNLCRSEQPVLSVFRLTRGNRS